MVVGGRQEVEPSQRRYRVCEQALVSVVPFLYPWSALRQTALLGTHSCHFDVSAQVCGSSNQGLTPLKPSVQTNFLSLVSFLNVLFVCERERKREKRQR